MNARHTMHARHILACSFGTSVFVTQRFSHVRMKCGRGQVMRVPLKKIGFWQGNRGGSVKDDEKWLSAKTTIGAMGDRAEGIIDTDMKNHHKKFRNFVYNLHEENDMFLGAHTMSLVGDKSDVFARELLFRGVGEQHHSFPCG